MYSKLIKQKNDTAKLYYLSQLEAIDQFEDLVKKHNIDCDFRRVDSYLYATNNIKQIKCEFAALREIGANVEYIDSPQILSVKATAAIKLPAQAIFESIKFLEGLPFNFEVIENTRIVAVDFKNKILHSSHASITAEKIVIATNFPIIDFPGWFFVRMYKSSSYAVAVDNAVDIGGIYQNDYENGLTFRNFKDNLIVGGLDHRTGRIDSINKFNSLYKKSEGLCKDGKLTHKWLANDCITFDYLPYAGYYSKKSKDIFVICGFNKWGMANAMISSALVSDMINGKTNRYETLFSPRRCGQFNVNFVKNLFSIINNIIIKPLLPPLKCSKSLKADEGAIVFHKFKKRAVYKDFSGELHVCQPLCAHLKCQLQFNAEAKSWDCPCHGSRFDIDGNIITAPSVKNIKPHK